MPVAVYLDAAAGQGGQDVIAVRLSERGGEAGGVGYLERQQHRAPGPTVSIGMNSGPLQVAGNDARQTQNLGTSADDLRLLITGIAEIVRALVPDAPDADYEEHAALAAVGDSGVDLHAPQRFRDWTLSTVRAGATSAAVAAVSSATTTLLIEAGRLSGHLG